MSDSPIDPRAKPIDAAHGWLQWSISDDDAGERKPIVPPDPEVWPLPNGRIAGGPYPGAKDRADVAPRLSRWLDAGFDCFVNLTERTDNGGMTPYREELFALAAERDVSVEYWEHPLPDQSTPMDPAQMIALLDCIDDAVSRGRRVYVHCWGGVGRTGTTIGCWLVRHGLDGEDALERVRTHFKQAKKSAYRSIPENPKQIAYVRQWAAHDSQLRARTTLNDRYLGSFMGLAVGDALGVPAEFSHPGQFIPITNIRGGGPFSLKPGEWTDDTSMAACLAESLVACEGFDATDQMERYVRWWHDAYWSSNGRTFDIGGTVKQALRAFEASGDPYAGLSDKNTAGNGSLMRLAPVALYFADDWHSVDRYAALMSRTTHGEPRAIDACRYYAGLIVGALRGVPKGELLSAEWAPEVGWWARHPLHPDISAIAQGSWRSKTAAGLPASGFVLDTLEAALWAFGTSSTFAEGALKAVNLGNDSDTTGAVYGQLAGAYYGCSAIPSEWLDAIAKRSELEALARRVAMGQSPRGTVRH